MRHQYDYPSLLSVLGNSETAMYGYNTMLKLGYNCVHVFYKDFAIATVTEHGVRTYRSSMPSESMKKRINSILRPINWALVTRNDVTFLLYRPTKEVVTFNGHTMCYPSGDYADVDTKPILNKE